MNKRRDKCSTLLRGFQTEDVEAIRNEVREICHIFNTDVVELEGLVKIGRNKVLDKYLRSALLSNERNLRRIDQYKAVYIHRDLTYKQYQSLSQRRASIFASHNVGSRD